MRPHRAANQSGRRRPKAISLDRLNDGLPDTGIIGQIQVIVTAKQSLFGAVGHTNRRALCRVDADTSPQQAIPFERVQFIM